MSYDSINDEVNNSREYFEITHDDFNKLLTIPYTLNQSQQKIGLQVSGHYHMNLISFLHKNNYDICKINPYFIA